VTKFHNAGWGGFPETRAWKKGTPFKNVILPLLACHISLTFETSMTMLSPNSCIVVKRYVIRYQQKAMFTLFEESVKYHSFCVEALRYNKRNRDWRLDHYWKFFPSVHNMLPLIFNLGQHITNFGSQIFNNNFDASNYLYNVCVVLQNRWWRAVWRYREACTLQWSWCQVRTYHC